jgi:hypothetical protein
MSKIERRSYLKQVGALGATSVFAGAASAESNRHENAVQVFAEGDGDYRVASAKSSLQAGKDTQPSAAADGTGSASVESGEANFYRSASRLTQVAASAPVRVYTHGEFGTDEHGTVTVTGTGSYFVSTYGDRVPEPTTVSTGSVETGTDPGKVFASGELVDGEHVLEVTGDLKSVWVEETSDGADRLTVAHQRRSRK